jgi:hypothetical protein
VAAVTWRRTPAAAVAAAVIMVGLNAAERKEGEARNKRSVVCIQNQSLQMHRWPGLYHRKSKQRCPKIQNSGRIRSGPSDNRGDPARSPPSPGCESYVAGGWEGFIVPYTLSGLLEWSRRKTRSLGGGRKQEVIDGHQTLGNIEINSYLIPRGLAKGPKSGE